MAKRKLAVRSWWFGLFLTIVLGVAFFLVLVRVTKSTITNQFIDRQQTLSRAQAGNIISFFQIIGDSVAVLSKLTSLEYRDARTLSDMDAFVGQRRESGFIGGLILTNRQGVVQFNPNILDSPDLGDSIEDRDYFAWARGQSVEGTYFIGEPVISRIGASQGQAVVPVASPVFQNGVFTGIVATSVFLQPLTESYLEFFEGSGSYLADVYLTKEDGELLYAKSEPDMVGSNISDILGDELKEALVEGREGNLTTRKSLVTYTPIDLGSQRWFLVMASPTTEVLELARPLYIRQFAILLLVALSILVFGVLFMQAHTYRELS